jgi:hypothetical protein
MMKLKFSATSKGNFQIGMSFMDLSKLVRTNFRGNPPYTIYGSFRDYEQILIRKSHCNPVVK